jgi:gamma-glutamylcyclotransferase (GGCT)/AIG2-like uncharacterized protein YtfP
MMHGKTQSGRGKMHKVFVYGTLRDKHPNPLLVGDSIWGHVINMGRFPALISTSSELTIVGDVIEVSDRGLEEFDIYEGYPNFYTREIVTTMAGHLAWVYVLAGSTPILEWNNDGEHTYHETKGHA